MWGKPWDVLCGVSYEVCHVGHVGQVGSAIATTCPSGIYVQDQPVYPSGIAKL